MTKDEKWMKVAINEAKLAMNENEVPVGAVLVLNNKLIAQAHNQWILNNDASAHAEIQLIRKAGKYLNNYRLVNSILYVTLEPCAMCLGAIVHARIDQIVFGAFDSKSGVCGSVSNLINEPYFNHKIIAKGGVLEHECKNILQTFFKTKRHI